MKETNLPDQQAFSPYDKGHFSDDECVFKKCCKKYKKKGRYCKKCPKA